MRAKYQAVATLGSFKDKETGRTVKRYLTVGTVFESPNGKLFMRLDGLPVSKDWSGFIAFRDASAAAPAPEDPEAGDSPE